MSGRKGTKHLTEKEFGSVKLMQKAKLSKSQVAKITGRSWASVDSMYQADTWKDFLKQRKARHDALRLKRSASPVEVEKDVPVPVSVTITNEEIAWLINTVGGIDMKHNTLHNKVEKLQSSLNKLVDAEERREAGEKVAGWKFGRSR